MNIFSYFSYFNLNRPKKTIQNYYQTGDRVIITTTNDIMVFIDCQDTPKVSDKPFATFENTKRGLTAAKVLINQVF